jgi:hypothetical protein
MSSAAWARLLRFIPETEHDSLMLITANRTEIAIQAILRIDPDFLIIKGRLAGSQDAGRVFFIPYEQLDHIGFNRAVKDAEFNEMFAGFDAPSPAALTFPEAAADGNSSPTPAPPTMKSAVLERFRSRATIIARSPLTRPAPGSDPSLPQPDEQKAE